MNTHFLRRSLWLPALLIVSVLLNSTSCTKYDDNLNAMNEESGAIQVRKNGVNIGEAQIDEEVTLYAKIGQPGANIKWFVSGVEATILSHGTTNATLVLNERGTREFPVDTFNIVIPRNVVIGPGTIYFSIDGLVKPALAFTVKRPDILIPNKVQVEPFLFTVSDSVLRPDGLYDYIIPRDLKDGPQKQAVVNVVMKLTYDQNEQAFYFMDFEGDAGNNIQVIRRFKGGVVTTIAGGGNDFLATTGSNLKLGGDGYPGSGKSIDMEPGPDGKLYFTNFFDKLDDQTGYTFSYSVIQSLDPNSGKVETVLGNNKRSVDYYFSNYGPSYRGIEDGHKDSAMIFYPRSLTFGKDGNLYFLDGASEYGYGSLFRKLTPAGMIETVLGTVNKEVYEFEDADGKVYKPVFYSETGEDSDGFGDNVRLRGIQSMVQAGNGKFYLLRGSYIAEVNLDTKEYTTIIGSAYRPGAPSTGTFKEVQLGTTITTFDVDFDGNILFGFNSIYKIDLQTELVSFVAGSGRNDRLTLQQTLPGNEAGMGRLNKITFDQFGNLYAGYDYTLSNVDVRIGKITIER